MALHKRRIFKIVSAILAIFIIFFMAFLYLGFLDWKKTLITKIASESTMFAGQDVIVGDLSLSLFRGLTLKDISVKNPKGFDSGNLLRIKKLYLKTRYRELVGGVFHFDRVVVTSPEITLIEDKNGHVNISEKLMRILKGEEKTEIKYQIDEFRIESGTFEFRRPDSNISGRNISVHLRNISSDPGEKTLIKASALFSGSTVNTEGWVYLKDTPKTFALSVTSEDFNPDLFREVLKKYKVNTEKAKINFSINAEGDTEEKMQFTSKFHIAGARSGFLNKDIKDIQIDANGSFNIREDSLNIESLSFRADHVAEAQMRAIMKNIRKDPSYEVTFKINKMDLSALNVMPTLTTGGVVTSDTIHVEGGLKKDETRFSGGVRCTDFALRSAPDDMNMKNGTGASASDTQTAVKDELDGSAGSTVKMPYNISAGDIKGSFKGAIGASGYHGNGTVNAKGVSVSNMDNRRNILKDTSLNSEFTFRGNDFTFRADARTGKIVAKISGTVREFLKQDRSIAMQANLPEIRAADIRDSLWDIFPDSLLYAGLDGKIASTVAVNYKGGALGVTGDIQLSNVFLEGENSEYAVGPVNGTVPVAYSNRRTREKTLALPSFERSEYDSLLQYYSLETPEGDYKRITIGSMAYGFKLLENITLLVYQKEGVLNIRHVRATIFGGRLNGSALIDIHGGLQYRAGFLVKGLSLTRLCDGITPIRGYISGKIDGIAQIKGSGGRLSQLIGKADFWTYATKDEKTRISREFLQQVGGTSLKMYLGDRAYDKGILDLYIKDSFIMFKELEISNRNFLGIQDLSVKVVPLNNKISIDHLMWTIVEAAHRAKKK